MKIKTINESVAEELSKLGRKRVNDVIKNKLVDDEINRRTSALMTAIQKHRETEKALRKIKPDMVAYNDAGEVISSNYSKAKFEEKKKALEQLERIDKAIDAATGSDDFSGVYKIAESKNEPESTQTASD